jgi:hypothetical protein
VEKVQRRRELANMQGTGANEKGEPVGLPFVRFGVWVLKDEAEAEL